MRTFIACLLLVGCATSQDDLAPQGPVVAGGKGDGQCPIVPASIAPTENPPLSCGALDSTNAAIVADVDRFWGSNVIGCACGPDGPDNCVGAFSLFTHGYIWIGVDFINGITTSTGSLMPAQYAIAHEFGHELQGHYNHFPEILQVRELEADCLSGYYLGSVACNGQASEDDLRATLGTACVIADGTGDPIADLETHGTCVQRVSSVVKGMQGYLAGQRPFDACP